MKTKCKHCGNITRDQYLLKCPICGVDFAPEPKTVLTVWRKWTYEVWGDKADGYEVNDRRSHGTVEIQCRIEINNPGTPQEFKSAYPSNGQLQNVFGTRCHLSIDGDDCTIYVNRAKDGFPIGELLLESHKALSPITELDK